MNQGIEMSASTNQLIEPQIEEGLESQPLSRTKPFKRFFSRNISEQTSTSLLALAKTCGPRIKHAFRDAWQDISSPDRFKSPQSRRTGCLLLVIIWISGLLYLLFYLPLGMLDTDASHCRSDGEFYLDTKWGIWLTGVSRFNWWAFKAFFEVTLSWGELDFTSVKTIDVAWNLLIGRGGQGIMSLVTWFVFTEYLEVAIASQPVTFATLWLLRFHQDTSLLSTIRLFWQFFRRGLASKFAMFVMIAALSFTLAFPTVAGSMSGYATFNEPFVETKDGKLFPLGDMQPIAYVIHDGDRMKGYNENHIVPWRNGSSLERRYNYDYAYCYNHTKLEDGCELQRKISQYVQRYGFNVKDSKDEGKHDQTTELDGQEIPWPPLQISAYYLPTSFYWNWSETGTPWEFPWGKWDNMRYRIDSDAYTAKELKQHGVCHPRQEDDIQLYRWGFSFLQLYFVIVLLFLWSLSLMGLWKQAHGELKLNHREATSKEWKALLDFTNEIQLQLEQANIEINDLSDEQLEDEIQTILDGGSISSQPLTAEPPFSIWRWLLRVKWWIGAYICAMSFTVALTIVETRYIYDLWFPVLLPLLLATCLCIAFAVGSTLFQRVSLFVIAGGLSYPLVKYSWYFSEFVLLGCLVGLFLAFGVGSTKGSRFVLFSLPALSIYFPILIWGLRW